MYPRLTIPGDILQALERIRSSRKTNGLTCRETWQGILEAVRVDASLTEAAKALASRWGRQFDTPQWKVLVMAVQTLKAGESAWENGAINAAELPIEVINRGLLSASSEEREAALAGLPEEFADRVREVLKAEDAAVEALMADINNIVGAATRLGTVFKGPKALELIQVELVDEAKRRLKESAEAEVIEEATPELPAGPTPEEIQQAIEGAIAGARGEIQDALLESNVEKAITIAEKALRSSALPAVAQSEEVHTVATYRVELERASLIREVAPNVLAALEKDDADNAWYALMTIGVYPSNDGTAEEARAVLASAGVELPPTEEVVTEPAPSESVEETAHEAPPVEAETVEEAPAPEAPIDPVGEIVAGLTERGLRLEITEAVRTSLERLVASAGFKIMVTEKGPDAVIEVLVEKHKGAGALAKSFQGWSSKTASPLWTALNKAHKAREQAAPEAVIPEAEVIIETFEEAVLKVADLLLEPEEKERVYAELERQHGRDMGAALEVLAETTD